MRVISGVILGYLVFALPAFALFRMTHHDPHAPASIAFEVFSTLYGILFALLAGYLGCALAGRRDLLTAWIIAAIVALGAAASMIAKGISWSPITGLVFMAPAVVLGGWLRLRQAWIRQYKEEKVANEDIQRIVEQLGTAWNNSDSVGGQGPDCRSASHQGAGQGYWAVALQ